MTSPASARLPDEMLEAVAARFRALSQAPRLRLLESLLGGPRTVGDLAALAALSQANASKHLAVLAEAGFVTRRRERTSAVYGLADDLPERLCALLCTRVLAEAEAGACRLRGGADLGGAATPAKT